MKVVLALPGLVALYNLVGVPLLGVTTGRKNEDEIEEYHQPPKVINNEEWSQNPELCKSKLPAV